MAARLALMVLLPLLVPAGEPASVPSFSAPTQINNAHAPFEPGAMKVYTGRSHGASSVIVEDHLAETRVFLVQGVPVETVILRETEFLDGELVEVSLNYFAQADDGAVYSFGEMVDDYVDGELVAHDGSWLVGGPTSAGDAPETGTALLPAEYMPAAPGPGDSWKPDDLHPVAVATATVLADGLKVKVKAGSFDDVLLVEEQGEVPDLETERKWYAPQAGLVKAGARGESLQLVASTLGGGDN